MQAAVAAEAATNARNLERAAASEFFHSNAPRQVVAKDARHLRSVNANARTILSAGPGVTPACEKPHD
jgi:hypothetical protein